MLGYHATSLLATFALCAGLPGVACGEARQRAFVGHFHRGDGHLRLFHEEAEGELARPVVGAHHRVSAALPVGEGHFSREQFYWSPDQRRRTQSSCAVTSPIDITSSLSSEAEGCYFQTEVASDGGVETVYTPSGGPGVGQWWMHQDGITSLPGTYWWLSFVTAVDAEEGVESTEDLCRSIQISTTVTPAEVTGWNCGTDFVVSADVFSVACGGSCTDASTARPSSAPVVETVEPTANVTPGPSATMEEAPPTPSPSAALVSEGTPSPAVEEPTPSPSAAFGPEGTPVPTPGSRGLDTPAPSISATPDEEEVAPAPEPSPTPGPAVETPPTPGPAVETPQPNDPTTPEGNCAAIDITSTLSSDVEGCYFQTEVEVDGGVEIVYTPSGGPEVGQWWMHPDGLQLNGVPLPGAYWWLSFATSVDEEGGVTSSEDLCKSNQAITSANTPADVTSWNCGSGDEFSVVCGGSCTDSSTPTEPPEPSPTPDPATETEPTPTPEPAVETVEPTAEETPEPIDAPTPTPGPMTPGAEELTPAPEPVGGDSTQPPSAYIVPETTPVPTPVPTPGSRGLETSVPTVSVTPDSSDAANLVPGATPAPSVDVNEEAASAGDRRASWSMFHTVASAATVIALVVA